MLYSNVTEFPQLTLSPLKTAAMFFLMEVKTIPSVMLGTNFKVHLYYTMEFFKIARQLYKCKRKLEMLKRSNAAMIEPKGK